MLRNAPALSLCLLVLASCSSDVDEELRSAQSNSNVGIAGAASGRNSLIPVDDGVLELRPAPVPERRAFFGDLHVHTANSFDAYVFGTLATPADAYRYARGESLMHPSGFEVQLQRPLDFYAVTDHAMFMGLVKEAADTTTEFSRYPISELLHDINAPDNMTQISGGTRYRAFFSFIPGVLAGIGDGSIDSDMVAEVSRRTWRNSVMAADSAYVPGTFTTFAAYEYTSSTDDRGNLHRNVIFRGTDKLPVAPFSRLNSQNPEGLWDWMDGLRDQGIESLAIPHNSNGSNGQMFKMVDWAGDPLDDAYGEQRLRNEPVVEITQVKGTSDTHPLLSTNDEWADFEIAPYRVATQLYSEPAGGYVRDAYLRGLQLSEQGSFNPYRFGLVGASDTHTGAASLDESNYFSKVGLLDGTAEARGSIPASFLGGAIARWFDPDLIKEVGGRDYMAQSSFEVWSASGITGVWAEENTREAIYDAFRRKETFATTGPRIQVRFFAGAGFADTDMDDPASVSAAYANGIAMGGELSGTEAPEFLVWAAADADGTRLQRVQIIKGWLKDGEHREQVYDVACSDGLSPDPANNRCPDNGARVNTSDCSITAGVGAADLKTVWRDPDFQPDAEAFYYVRVLENPTCRWSTWDAIKAGVEPRSDLPETIQERAWSSPIWYRPSPQDETPASGEA